MGPLTISIVLLIGMILVPPVVYFPFYLFRFIKARRLGKRQGLNFKPSGRVLVMYIWFILTPPAFVFFPAMISFNPPNSRPLRYQGEAQTNLGAIFMGQAAYYGEYSTYAGRKNENGQGGAFMDIGWGPEGDTRYSYYVGGDYIASTKPGHEMTCRLDGEWPFAVRPESTDQGFTAIAVGNIDRDECLDVWTINDAKMLNNVVDDRKTDCPRSRDAKTVFFDVWDGVQQPLFMAASLLVFCSPAMVVVIPLLYTRVPRERRKYLAARFELKE